MRKQVADLQLRLGEERDLIARYVERMDAIQRLADQLTTWNDELKASLTQSVVERDSLRNALALGEKQITTLSVKVHRFSEKIRMWQLRSKRAINSSHHLGNFRYMKKGTAYYGVKGTAEGAMGFIPTDTGHANIAGYDWGDGPFSTFSWRQVEDGKSLYESLFSTGWYDEVSPDRNVSYPQVDYPAFAGLHFDPDPPDPKDHWSGFLAELEYWMPDSIFEPSRARRKKNIETVVNNWRKRTRPLVEIIQQLYDFNLGE